MKKLSLVFLSLIIISTGCKKKEKSLTPTPTPQSTMTPWETSLVGQWKLKRTELRMSLYQPGLGDSTWCYSNHYNYSNSKLELKSTLYTNSGSTQMYDGIFGMQDGGPTFNIGWYGANNTIFTDVSGNFTVHYLSFAPDSLVVDYSGNTRYFFNKSNALPVLNNIESQLIGGTWTLVSQNGVSPSTPTYKMFFNNWYNSNGYYCKDSTYYNGTGSASPSYWEVLFPNRAIPILSSGYYYKITNLTANGLILEVMGNPQVNSNTTTTYIYSR